MYRGTSLITDRAPLGPYIRTAPRALWWSWGGGVGAPSYERGTPGKFAVLSGRSVSFLLSRSLAPARARARSLSLSLSLALSLSISRSRSRSRSRSLSISISRSLALSLSFSLSQTHFKGPYEVKQPTTVPSRLHHNALDMPLFIEWGATVYKDPARLYPTPLGGGKGGHARQRRNIQYTRPPKQITVCTYFIISLSLARPLIFSLSLELKQTLECPLK